MVGMGIYVASLPPSPPAPSLSLSSFLYYLVSFFTDNYIEVVTSPDPSQHGAQLSITAFNVFAGCTCGLLYIFTDFQVSEMLHRGTELS